MAGIYDIIMGSEPDAQVSANALANAIRGSRSGQNLYALGAENVPMALMGVHGRNAALDSKLLEGAVMSRAKFGQEAQAARDNALRMTLDARAREGDLNRQTMLLRASIAANGKGPAVPQVDDAVLTSWAKQRLGNGTFPVQARGNAAIREMIEARALELNPGFDPAEVVAASKSDASARANLQKNRESVGAFEQTLVKNAELLGSLIDKLPNTGVTVLNRPVRALYRAMGDVPTAQAEVGFRSIQAEAARVVSTANATGVLSDQSRREWEEAINSAATPEQLRGVIEYIKKETENRIKSMDEGISAISERQRQRATPVGDAAPAAGAAKVRRFKRVNGKLVEE